MLLATSNCLDLLEWECELLPIQAQSGGKGILALFHWRSCMRAGQSNYTKLFGPSAKVGAGSDGEAT